MIHNSPDDRVRIAVPLCIGALTGNLQFEASNAATPELALDAIVLDFAVADEIQTALEAATEQKVDAILLLSDPMALGNAARIGAFSLRYKIPRVSPFPEITDAEGLLS